MGEFKVGTGKNTKFKWPQLGCENELPMAGGGTELLVDSLQSCHFPVPLV